MNRLLSILTIGVLCLTPSCGMFSSDPTPAIIALEELDNEFLDTLDSFKDVISNSTLSDDVKNQILAKIAAVSSKREAAVKALRDFLLSLGDIDLATWADKLHADYLALRQQRRDGE